MMKRYNVIWIDDEWDKQTTFIELCKVKHGIHIMPFKNSKDGMCELESNLAQYDAVILDAKVYDKSDNEVATLKGLQSSIKKIESLSNKKKIPYFISTGQPDLYSNDFFKQQFGKFYSKETDDDELIRDLIIAADTQIETQIRHEYHKVFSVFSNDLGGENELLDILMSLKGYKEINEKTYYTQLRLILEWMFRDANKKGLLHDKCIYNNSKVNLTESSLFLAGKQTKYLGVFCAIAHFPKIIADNIKTLLEITGGASHTSKPEESELVNLHTYWKQINTPYLLYSLTFMLCDILIWYKDYISQNCDININKSHWKNIPQNNILTGKITNLSSAGFAYLKPNGSIDSKENCSIKSECCYCQNIKSGDILTVEYIIKQNKFGQDIRTTTRIIRKEE